MRLHRLPSVPVAVLKKAAYAEPPGRVPRGYFDALLPVTRTLLDRGLKISAAADWLIASGTLPPRVRGNFINTMSVRFTRLRFAEQKAAPAYSWKMTLGMDSCHAIPKGRTKSLCGSTAGLWLDADTGMRQCRFCLSVIKRSDS